MYINQINIKKLQRFFISLVLAAIVPLIFLSGAKAETSQYRIFSYTTKMEVMPIGFVTAPVNILLERRGLAHFENGEVATFLGRGTMMATPIGSTGQGYSLMTYNDGSTTVVKWDIKSTKSEKTQLYTYSGSGTFVDGTGRFKGIQGDVTFTGQEITSFTQETKSDAYFDVTATYTLPAKQKQMKIN